MATKLQTKKGRLELVFGLILLAAPIVFFFLAAAGILPLAHAHHAAATVYLSAGGTW